MNDTTRNGDVVGCLAGAVLGVCVLGALADVISYDPWRDGPVPLYIAAGAGAVAGVVTGVWVGAWELRGKVQAVAIGILAGTVLGVLAGVLYGAAIAAWSDDDVMRGKIEVAYRRRGIAVGMPAGCILGGLCGFIMSKKRPPGGGEGTAKLFQEKDREVCP